MPRKKKKPLSFVEIMQKLMRAGIKDSPSPNRIISNLQDITTLEERIEKILGIVNNNKRPAENMILYLTNRLM